MMNKMMTKSCSSWQHLYEQRFSDSYSAFTHILFKSSNSILTTALRDSLSLSSCSFASGLLCCGFDLIFVPSSILINNTTRAMSRWANLMRNNDNVPFNPFHLLPFAFVFSNALGDPAMLVRIFIELSIWGIISQFSGCLTNWSLSPSWMNTNHDDGHVIGSRIKYLRWKWN